MTRNFPSNFFRNFLLQFFQKFSPEFPQEFFLIFHRNSFRKCSRNSFWEFARKSSSYFPRNILEKASQILPQISPRFLSKIYPKTPLIFFLQEFCRKFSRNSFQIFPKNPTEISQGFPTGNTFRNFPRNSSRNFVMNSFRNFPGIFSRIPRGLSFRILP